MNLVAGQNMYLAVSWGVFDTDQSWWSPARAELTGSDAVAKSWPIDGQLGADNAYYLKAAGAALALTTLSLF